MNIFHRSSWILYKSFFNAVPGQRGLLAIGFLLMAFAYLREGSSEAQLFTMAGTAFAAGFTLLFAGPHFRLLASFRRHQLLPGFRMQLIASYLTALVTLALFALLGVTLLNQDNVLRTISPGTIWLSILCVMLITSLIGFLPGYLRYPAWLLIIVGAANSRKFSLLPIELLLTAIIGTSLAGLCCFIYLTGTAEKQVFYTRKSLSLSKYLPGLNGNYRQQGVTAVGSILLGISDGTVSRFSRAFTAAFLLPMALAGAALLAGKYSAEQFFKNPQFIFMGSIMAVAMQIHFAFAVSARRRFIWLRIGGDSRTIRQVAQKVLARERRCMLFCYAAWCVPAVAIFPNTAVWLLGVSTLLWCALLLLEQIILATKQKMTRRAEFYMLMLSMGLLIAPIASANVQQEPGMLWVGAAVALSAFSMLKLAGRIARSPDL